MSVQATTWVWEYSKAEGTTLLVALAIADAANREGRKSCQSNPTLARMVRASEATVKRAKQWLVEAGEIEKTGTDGRYATAVFCFPKMDPTRLTGDPAHIEPPAHLEQRPGSPAPLDPAHGYEPLPQEDNPIKETPSSDGSTFSELVDIYPKVEKPKIARARFAEAVRRGVSPFTIVAAARAQRTALLEREARYIPDLTSWLEDERWEGKLETRPPERETDDYGNVKNTRPLTDEERDDLVRRAREKREQP